MDKLILIGGGGFAAEASTYIKDNHEIDFVVYDDEPSVHPLLQNRLAGNIDKFIEDFDSSVKCFIAIGDSMKRKKVHERIQHLEIDYFSFIHPTATVSSTAKLGLGSFLYPYTIRSMMARISFLMLGF